jgi:hypothetical protein
LEWSETDAACKISCDAGRRLGSENVDVKNENPQLFGLPAPLNEGVGVGTAPIPHHLDRRRAVACQNQVIATVCGTAVPEDSPTPDAADGRIIKTVFTASGDIGDYDDEKKEKIAEAFAAEAGVNVEAVSVTVEAGSVLITVEITMPDAAAAAAVATKLQAKLADAEAATAFLADANVTVEEIDSDPAVMAPDGNDADDDDDDQAVEDAIEAAVALAGGALIAAIVVPIVVVLAICLCVIVLCLRKSGGGGSKSSMPQPASAEKTTASAV